MRSLIISCLLIAHPISSCSDDDATPDVPFSLVSGSQLLSSGLQANSMDGEAVDIDEDGDIDMIIAREFATNTILINDGTGRLVDESASRFPGEVHDSEDIAIADFDDDGDLDIVFVSEDDEVNEYYRNRGNATFELVSGVFPVEGITNAVETTDLNNDGFPDLILGNAGQNFVFINLNGEGFRDETEIRVPDNTFTTQDIDLADVDGDGDLDWLEANEAANRLLINDGDGFFTDESAGRLPTLVDQTREADLGDIDNDGDLDIHFANVNFGGFGDPQNRLLINDGQGIFTEAQDALPQVPILSVDADFIDINGDGYLDLLSGNRWNDLSNLVLINDTEGGFTDQSAEYFPELSVYTFDFQSADFNGDGLLDIYLCNFMGQDELLFAN